MSGPPLHLPMYTTADEVQYIRHLESRQDPEKLRRYLGLARARTWRGVGMAVDQQIVLLEAMDALGRVEYAIKRKAELAIEEAQKRALGGE